MERSLANQGLVGIVRHQADRMIGVSPGHAAGVVGWKEALVLLHGHDGSLGSYHVTHRPLQLLDGLKRRTKVIDVMKKSLGGRSTSARST